MCCIPYNNFSLISFHIRQKVNCCHHSSENNNIVLVQFCITIFLNNFIIKCHFNSFFKTSAKNINIYIKIIVILCSYIIPSYVWISPAELYRQNLIRNHVKNMKKAFLKRYTPNFCTVLLLKKLFWIQNHVYYRYKNRYSKAL